MFQTFLPGIAAVALVGVAGAQSIPLDGPFQRIATFPVFENSDVDNDTVAEICAVSEDGMTLIYTDAELGAVGFVDITDPANPLPGGIVATPGSPTSVGVFGPYALVCVDTSPSFTKPSGELLVLDIATHAVVTTIALGGQPDAISISPSGLYAAIAIENQRDEDLGSGEPPQAPPGFLLILDLVGAPAAWNQRVVDLVGVADLFPEDPEPEYVDISALDIAVVTLQENNHIVIVDLPTGNILLDYSCGTVDLQGIDTNENDLIEQTSSLQAVPREPDAVTWMSNLSFATANEGDLFGGSRGFTIWNAFGTPGYDSAASLDQVAARVGHYPESRSENKGVEPESVELGNFDGDRFLFVGSERASIVYVYQMFGNQTLGAGTPVLRQVLPTGVGPEGLLAIPERDLFVVSCETDARGDKIRASVMIYQRTNQSAYPTIASINKPGQAQPIPFSALSGLVAAPASDNRLFAVHDSYYQRSRVYRIDRSGVPAFVDRERELVDANGLLLAHLTALLSQLPDSGNLDPADLVNADGSVNLDLEGVALASTGDLWVCSEGAGNLNAGVSNPNSNPFASPNLLLRVNALGHIVQVVGLPLELVQNQLRFGFEGLVEVDGAIYVAFQREWTASGDPAGLVRIGRYDLVSGEWSYVYYPIETPASPAGGWVGLSELVHLGGSEFAVIERDDQGGPDAAIKHVTSFTIAGVTFKDESFAGAFDVVTKSLITDLLAAGTFAPFAGLTPEKIEGLAVLEQSGQLVIVNDNDGVEDNSGETLLIVLE